MNMVSIAVEPRAADQKLIRIIHVAHIVTGRMVVEQMVMVIILAESM